LRRLRRHSPSATGFTARLLLFGTADDPTPKTGLVSSPWVAGLACRPQNGLTWINAMMLSDRLANNVVGTVFAFQ
jgi:hypothetical protein